MLEWQTIVYVGGNAFTCLESYDSIHDRIRDGEIRQASGGESFQWMPPVELTVQGTGNPIRALMQPMAITCVLEIPADERKPVEAGPDA